MPLRKDYHEVIDILVSVLRAALDEIMALREEIHNVKKRWPGDDLVLSDTVPIIPFTEGIEMLRGAGEDAKFEDLSTPHEIKLGELVKARYHTDFYVLDKFPTSARPFYTQFGRGRFRQDKQFRHVPPRTRDLYGWGEDQRPKGP